MMRSFKYRLQPTRAQERTLLLWLEIAREVYNAALQERQDAWNKCGRRVTMYEQFRQLALIRQERPDVGAMPVVALRGPLQRLERSMQAFWRRCKAGEHPGFPRFKNRDRFRTLEMNDLTTTGRIVAGGKRIVVSRLGKVKFRQHRPTEGTPKAIRITYKAGRWWLVIVCADVPKKLAKASDRDVGIDLGLSHLVATSDGQMFDVPLNERETRLRLERAQRRMTSRRLHSSRRTKARHTFVRHHEHAANARREKHILIAKALVATYGVIYHEALNMRGLTRGMLAKPIYEAAWGSLTHWLGVKAEEAGRTVVAVNPRRTSQTCPDCGAVKRKTLAQREHHCDCGLHIDRDVAAAIVIRDIGRAIPARAEALAA